jgi:hypothetical protein
MGDGGIYRFQIIQVPFGIQNHARNMLVEKELLKQIVQVRKGAGNPFSTSIATTLACLLPS